AVLVLLDATALASSLYLYAQVAQTGMPVVVGVSMLDVAAERGVQVDLNQLSQVLGCPVVGVNPRIGQGRKEAAHAVEHLLLQNHAAALTHPGSPTQTAL